MSDLTETIDTHLEAYGEPDPTRRSALIERVWAADGHLVDPPFDARGRDGISGLAAAVQEQFPGSGFRRVTGIDSHHGFARYGWELVGPEGDVTVAGIDVAELDTDGRIRRVVGFFGMVPEPR